MANTRMIGPFLDVNGNPLTALSIALSDIWLSKSSGAYANTSQSAGNEPVHQRAGDYLFTFPASDCDVAGPLRLQVDIAGDVGMCMDFDVYPAAKYDALFGSDAMWADVIAVNGDAGASLNLQLAAGTMLYVVVGATGNSTTTIHADSIASGVYDDNHFVGRTVLFTSGHLKRQMATITEYDDASNLLTVTQMTAIPQQNDTLIIV